MVGVDGGVASRFTPTDADCVPPAPVAEQVSVVPVVSVETAAGPQPVVDSTDGLGSLTFQATLTGERYQPFAPSGAAGLSAAPTVDGVVACATTRSA